MTDENARAGLIRQPRSAIAPPVAVQANPAQVQSGLSTQVIHAGGFSRPLFLPFAAAVRGSQPTPQSFPGGPAGAPASHANPAGSTIAPRSTRTMRPACKPACRPAHPTRIGYLYSYLNQQPNYVHAPDNQTEAAAARCFCSLQRLHLNANADATALGFHVDWKMCSAALPSRGAQHWR
jgi:hypothetical protein